MPTYQTEQSCSWRAYGIHDVHGVKHCVTEWKCSHSADYTALAAAQCIVIGLPCLQRVGGVCGWVCESVITYMEGQKLRHDPSPVYLGVTLDRTLSYRQHLTKMAGKTKPE